MRLYDVARVMRSKNAGPFTLSIDMLFKDEKDFDRTMTSLPLAVPNIAVLYRVDPSVVTIHPFRRALAIKVTLPRPVGSGAPGDCDVYGSQQHFPLAGIDI